MAGGAIASFLKDVAGGFFGNDYLRDYTHASNTFRSNLYQNAPKFKFLFHVYFNINSTAVFSARDENFGLLVKSVKLPSFNMDAGTLNQYNRKRIVQTKIKYDPVSITFHDDGRNLINSMWYRYYTYYYRDGLHPNVVFSGNRGSNNTSANTMATYNDRNIYKDYNSSTEEWDWGFIGDTATSSGVNSVREPFFKDITIFGFNQHDFIAYTLINPIITSFNHDTYAYDDGNGTMENNMTLQYETVVYNQGALDGNKPDDIVSGFGTKANYDRRTSPIMAPGSNSNILGPNGILDGVGGVVQSLTGPNTNILQAVKIAGTTYNSFKNVGLNTITAEVKQNIQNALQGGTNDTRQKLFDIPIYGQTPSIQSSAGVPPANTQAPAIASLATAGSQITNAFNTVVSSVSSSVSKFLPLLK